MSRCLPSRALPSSLRKLLEMEREVSTSTGIGRRRSYMERGADRGVGFSLIDHQVKDLSDLDRSSRTASCSPMADVNLMSPHVTMGNGLLRLADLGDGTALVRTPQRLVDGTFYLSSPWKYRLQDSSHSRGRI